MSELRFSIVVACYNQEGFVREAVESALSQKPPSKEIIVVDDGSRDGTADVLKTFGASIQENQVLSTCQRCTMVTCRIGSTIYRESRQKDGRTKSF